jgi:hypothetical protein
VLQLILMVSYNFFLILQLKESIVLQNELGKAQYMTVLLSKGKQVRQCTIM